MEVFHEYLKAFKKCTADYFGEDVLPERFDGYKEFGVAVSGGFKAGKSTLINAILGEERLRMSNFPTTFVIELIRYGEGSDCNITIHYRNGDMEVLSQQDYAKKFPCIKDEYDLPFKLRQEISYAELHSVSNIISRNIVFAEMPTLSIPELRFGEADEILLKADAVLFILSATHLFDSMDQDYIEYIMSCLAVKQLKNIFFIINRINQLDGNELEDSLIPFVRNHLRGIFTNRCGVFDEALFDKRVFFVNAYGALCARTGAPYQRFIDGRQITVPIDLDDTGFPKFEEALMSFIEEQRRREYKRTMQGMMQTYQRLYGETLEALKKDRHNCYEHNRGNHRDPRMDALQAMREYMGYCFEDLYGHQLTDLELSLMK